MSAVSYTGLTGIPALGYTYDNNGNITALKQGSAIKESYTYDALNQLTRVNSLVTNKTTVYAYDNGGNITGVKEYAYTTGPLDGLTPTDTKTYTYGNTSWPDLLTAYDGTPITYDAIGNPTSYRGASMTWSGRRLSSYSKSGVTVSYVYNESGIRTQKTVDGTTTEYFLSGSTILAEKAGSNITWYLYDSLGNPVGYEYGGAKYWYITNLQGDILYVVNSAGTPIGSYTYSPYGDFTATVLSSSDSTAFSANHLTYRGYYYDAETGLYYVSSRYYDPETRRFVNADDVKVLTVEPGEMTEKNLYAYCNNNPVNFQDKEGEFALAAEGVWLTANILVNVGVSFLAAQVVGQKFTLKDAAGIAVATIVSVVCKKALLGALAGAVIMGGSTFIFSMDNGASKKNALINGVTAAACSFISIGTCMDAANVGKTGFTLVEKALFGLENGLIYSSITEAMSRTNTNKKNKSKKQEKSKAKANTNVKKRRSRTQMLQDHFLQKMKSLGYYA